MIGNNLHNPFALMARKYALEVDAVLEGEDGAAEFVSEEWENLLRDLAVLIVFCNVAVQLYSETES